MFVFVALLALHSLVNVNGGCVNEDGRTRPWFVMFKMPGGYNYLYADSVETQLRPGEKKLTDKNNPVSRVLEPIYSNSKNTNFLMYNDEVPDGPTTSNRGHTKGIVIWSDDPSKTTWLVHSAPNFPPQQEKGYSYPETAMRYGQSFLCVEGGEVSTLAQHLFYTWPLVYNATVKDEFREKFPTLDLVLKAKHVKQAPWVKIQRFTTGSVEFASLAKSGEFGGDLYKDIVAPYIGENIFTETWQNGRGRVPSNCSDGTNVFNINTMKLCGNEYNESQDHSKWAISQGPGHTARSHSPRFGAPGQGGFLCIGGINRMTSQFTRGGGTLCFRPPVELWQQVLHGIQLYEKCQN